MQTNSGYEPDNDGNGRTTQTNATATNGNRPPSNEGTLLNVNVDTYFSEEKIRIPEVENVNLIEPVSTLFMQKYLKYLLSFFLFLFV